MMPFSAKDLSELMRNRGVVVFTGAGMSTESGLPDFRSQGGLWHGKDPMQIASTRAIRENFPEFTSFYRNRIEERNKYQPHIGHRLLAQWEREGYVDGVVTQNVDGYHTIAGSRNVYELHGSLNHIYCDKCGKPYSEGEYMDQNWCSCGGRIRPGIVLFGESLPMDVFESAVRLVHQCKTLLVIGTSLQVTPANLIPAEARSVGAKVILINRDPIENPFLVDYWIQGSAKEILEEVNRHLSK
jgi:NAD-dependent deacetylase